MYSSTCEQYFNQNSEVTSGTLLCSSPCAFRLKIQVCIVDKAKARGTERVTGRRTERYVHRRSIPRCVRRSGMIQDGTGETELY